MDEPAGLSANGMTAGQTTQIFLEELKRLVVLEEGDAFKIDEWLTRSRSLVEFVRANSKLSDLIDEGVWHFLSDIDIRRRDAEYALVQREFVKGYLIKMQKELVSQVTGSVR